MRNKYSKSKYSVLRILGVIFGIPNFFEIDNPIITPTYVILHKWNRTSPLYLVDNLSQKFRTSLILFPTI